jgi:uncharacterized protein YggE
MTKIFMAALLAASMLAPAAPAAAQTAEPQPRRIVVLGEGEASVKPDIAILSLAVMREAPSAGEALGLNSKAMSDVIAALKAAGVAERDLQTAGVQINPRYDYVNKPDGTQVAKLAAYQVTNTVTVRVRDLAKTGEIIDKAVSLGVNQGGGVTFTNDDPKATLTEARKNAVADAIDKAKTLTEAAGVKLGQVMEITDVSYAQPPLPIQAKAFDGAAAEATPVEAGENVYKVQVNVTFALD